MRGRLQLTPLEDIEHEPSILCCNYLFLFNDKQSMLYDILTKYEFLFDRTQGTWKTKPVDIEPQPGAKPYHVKSYPVPRAHKTVFCKEIESFCQIEVF